MSSKNNFHLPRTYYQHHALMNTWMWPHVIYAAKKLWKFFLSLENIICQKKANSGFQERNLSLRLFVCLFLNWGLSITCSLLLCLADYTGISSILDNRHKTSLWVRKLVQSSRSPFPFQRPNGNKMERNSKGSFWSSKDSKTYPLFINQSPYMKSLYKYKALANVIQKYLVHQETTALSLAL